MPSGPAPGRGRDGSAGPCGLVVVDKPPGPTSHDVVARLRRIYGTRRVGHAGTLDPPATGILLAGLGRATRILQYLQALPKTYRADVAFGTTTSTQDATGDIQEVRPCTFGRHDLEEAMAALTGDIEQVPPMVSAVRVGGERLYVAARRGETVERAARPVTVYDFTLESFEPDPGGWRATAVVQCSSGTYVRTLAADVGERLGCGAHLHTLRRLAIGSFGEADAVGVDALEALDDAGRRQAVLPMAEALRDLPSHGVSGAALQDVHHGRALACDPAASCPEGGAVGVLDPGGELIAVYRRDGETLKPECVLVTGEGR
jgi:tRNA pseudouridine55 synthase